MDIIFGVIEIGCLLGVGLYIGVEGTEILIDLMSKGINLIIKKHWKQKNLKMNGVIIKWILKR